MEITFDGNKVVTAHLNGHIIRTDQPLQYGGNNSAPAPYDLFLASIGTCTGIYVKSFCDKRGIPADNIKITQTVEYDPEKKLPSLINTKIHLPAGFPEKYREALILSANQCAVKKTISDPPQFTIDTVID